MATFIEDRTAGHLTLTGGLDMESADTARTILVVEDNVLMRKLFVRCLEEGGYTVIEVDDPRAVKEVMLDGGPDLVVMDIVMPGLSGVDLIRAIRSDVRLSTIPVLAVTNLTTPADKRRLADAGFNGHVSKPIKPKDFLSAVGAFFGTGAAEPA